MSPTLFWETSPRFSLFLVKVPLSCSAGYASRRFCIDNKQGRISQHKKCKKTGNPWCPNVPSPFSRLICWDFCENESNPSKWLYGEGTFSRPIAGWHKNIIFNDMDGINLERIRMRLICNWQQAALFKLGISQVARTKVWNLTQKQFHIWTTLYPWSGFKCTGRNLCQTDKTRKSKC